MGGMVKICFTCRHENHPQESICGKCGEDIGSVRPIRKEVLPAEPAPSATTVVGLEPSVPPAQQPGASHPAATPQPATRRMAVPNAYLVCDAPGFPPFLILPNTTVGREVRKTGDVDVTPVPNSDYVSRQHVTFLLQGSRWLVRPERTMNGTWLNEELLPEGQPREIKTNDKLRLGMVTFTFRG
ncbi:FHA domain-containing protein [candidate division KSB1 bacterium]|nr:FHA domain-containing protein [candidate division KSB1 bacterium]